MELHGRQDWPAIAAHDQLLQQMQARRIFTGFEEGALNFAPTYRWSKKTREFSNKRGQSPSWCDRILWRSFPGARRELQLAAFTGADLLGSDHRPVSATFDLALRQPFTAPPPAMVHQTLDMPTYYADTDAPRLGVPVLVPSSVRVVRMAAEAAPAAIVLAVRSSILAEPLIVTAPASAGAPETTGGVKTVSFEWPEEEPALPALCPFVWDPRRLRASHLVVSVHSA